VLSNCYILIHFTLLVQVVETALALQEAGCFSVVLECVPAPVAAATASALQIPTIGIGAGPFCSGQVRLFAFFFFELPVCCSPCSWLHSQR
jgi:hypothetical protein